MPLILAPGSSEVKCDGVKLGSGLQQALCHPAKFQPDRANDLRDVRYQFFHFLTLGLTSKPTFTKRGDDLLPTQSTILPNFIALRRTTPEISDTKYLADTHGYTDRNSKRYIPGMPIGR